MNFSIIDLKDVLSTFKANPDPNKPSFIIRYEHQNTNRVIFQTFCFKFSEMDELVNKINDGLYFKSIVLVSQYLKSKGNAPSKARVQFKKKQKKVFSITSTELKAKVLKSDKIKITEFIPNTLLETLIKSSDDSNLFEGIFKCKLVPPFITYSSYFLSDENMFEFTRFVYKVFSFISKIVFFATESSHFHFHKPRLELFLKYLEKKKRRIERLLESVFFVKNKHKNSGFYRKA